MRIDNLAVCGWAGNGSWPNSLQPSSTLPGLTVPSPRHCPIIRTTICCSFLPPIDVCLLFVCPPFACCWSSFVTEPTNSEGASA